VDATQYAHERKNRKEIAAAIAPRNFLNQPVEVVEAVLTGEYDNGLGQKLSVPDRIDFDPFPYHSMAIWILTQMKRWGYVKGDLDYKAVAEQVFLADQCRQVMKSLGVRAPEKNQVVHAFAHGRQKTFDPARPEEYLKGFTIKRV
jgi:nitrate/nitrite transport system substrate-binding protein